MSSFESMTGLLDSSEWYIHAPAMYQRNWPCDSMMQYYFSDLIIEIRFYCAIFWIRCNQRDWIKELYAAALSVHDWLCNIPQALH